MNKIHTANKMKKVNSEPIHYHMLPLNKPHPCDKHGCSRETKYYFGYSFYCDDKAVSRFKGIAKKGQQEGFKLIEYLVQLEM